MKVTFPTLYCDLETFSAKDIRAGSHAYAADPSAEVLLWGYAIDDAPAKVWDVTAGPMPEELRQALDEVARKERRHVWQNGVMFDRVFLSYVMPEIELPMETLDDTMVMAYQAGLPGSLKELCEVFHLSKDKAKDADGSRLIQIFCKPLPSTWKLDRATSKTHPEEWAKFVNYCRLDIESMREVYKKLPAFNRTPKERELQVLDATINMRGIGVDVEFAEAAIATAERAKKDIDKQVFKLTDGRVVTAGQRDALIQFFFDKYGWQLKDMRKSELEKRMEDPDIPDEMKELICLRLMGTKTSVQKYKRVVQGAVDGRLRGCMQFRGASRTGRVSGRTFQPQNLPRPLIKSQEEIEQIIEDTKLGILEICYEDVSVPLSSAIRSVIVPAAGNRLCVADFSNVEGRVLAWLAGEEWKLDAFREFDTLKTKSGEWALPYRDGWFQEWAVNEKGDFIHKGHDLYKLTYARTFGIKPEEVTKDQRQMGKVLELALGYQGGPGAFATFAMNFGMDLDDLAKTTEGTIEESYWIESMGMLKWAKEKKLIKGMSQKAWVACNAIKSAWRKANSEIESFWYSLAKACQSAIKAKGVAFSAGRIVCKVSGNYLLMRLPSGRYLVYPAPRLPEEDEMCDFSFMGVNQYTKKWERISTYSGKLCIAKGTLVVTVRGLVAIENVKDTDLVWDGHEFVQQEGSVAKGTKEVIQVYGVYMTPDHKVLTEEGWKNASSCEGLNRASCRLPDGYLLRGVEREKFALEGSVRLREGETDGSLRVYEAEKERSQGVVRLHEAQDFLGAETDTWNVEAPCLRSVALNEAEVRMPDTPCLQKLWRQGHKGLRALVKFLRGLLGGHGADVQAGSDARPNRCEQGLLPGKLPLGNHEGTGKQHSQNEVRTREATLLLEREDRDWGDNPSVSVEPWVSDRALVRQARLFSEVFDLINCGPRHQFVVIADGAPLIVHNCENAVQGAACDLLLEAGPRLEAAGYHIVMSVHDEYITEIKDDNTRNHREMEKIMSDLPDWADGLPLVAAGFEAARYRKD